MAHATRESIIHAAITNNVAELERIVMFEGAAIVRLDDDPQQLTALHLAAAAGQLNSVNYLLSAAVEADARAARCNNFTPLHSAAMNGHAAICEVLISAGADVNVQTNPQGYAPLHSAAFAGHIDAIRVLLAHGADRNLVNYRNERPADTATRTGQIEAMQLLGST